MASGTPAHGGGTSPSGFAVPEPLPAPVPESTPISVPATAPEGAPVSAPRSGPKAALKSAPGVRAKPAPKRAAKAKELDPADYYAAELAAGELPSLRRIRADLHVGQDKAKVIQTEIAALLTDGVPVAA